MPKCISKLKYTVHKKGNNSYNYYNILEDEESNIESSTDINVSIAKLIEELKSSKSTNRKLNDEIATSNTLIAMLDEKYFEEQIVCGVMEALIQENKEQNTGEENKSNESIINKEAKLKALILKL